MNWETKQPEPQPVISVAEIEPRRRTGLIIFAWLIACIALAVVWYDLGGYRDYLEGLHNENGVFIPVTGVFVWAGCLALNASLFMWVAIKPNTIFTRMLIGGATLFLLFVCVATVVFRPLPEDAYSRGFGAWAAKNIAADSVRAWIATNPISKTPVTLTPPFPPVFTALSPASVTVLPDNTGVVLEWGQLSSWGNARRIVIMTDPNATAWDDLNGHFPSYPMGPGMYGGRQWTN